MVVEFRRVDPEGGGYEVMGRVEDGRAVEGREALESAGALDMAGRVDSTDELLGLYNGPRVLAVELDGPPVDEKAGDSGPWMPYAGPDGGTGWQNVDTNEVRYTDEPPGEPLDEDQLESYLKGVEISEGPEAANALREFYNREVGDDGMRTDWTPPGTELDPEDLAYGDTVEIRLSEGSGAAADIARPPRGEEQASAGTQFEGPIVDARDAMNMLDVYESDDPVDAAEAIWEAGEFAIQGMPEFEGEPPAPDSMEELARLMVGRQEGGPPSGDELRTAEVEVRSSMYGTIDTASGAEIDADELESVTMVEDGKVTPTQEDRDRHTLEQHGGDPPPGSIETPEVAMEVLGDDPGDMDVSTAVDSMNSEDAGDLGRVLAAALRRGASPHEMVRGARYSDRPLEEYETTAKALMGNTTADVDGFDSQAILAPSGSFLGGTDSDLGKEVHEQFREEYGHDAAETVNHALREWQGSMFGDEAAPLFQAAADMTGNETVPETHGGPGFTFSEGGSDIDRIDPHPDSWKNPYDMAGESVYYMSAMEGETEVVVEDVELDPDDGTVSEVTLHEPADDVLSAPIDPYDKEDMEAFIAAQQEALRDAFGDTVTVYRGLSGNPSNPTDAKATAVSEKLRRARESAEGIEHEHRTAEAWSTDPTYANEYNQEEHDGVMIRKEAPVEKVVASAITSNLPAIESELILAHDEVETYEPEDVITAEEADSERMLLEAARSASAAMEGQQ